MSMPGKFLNIVSQDPIDSKSSQLHVDLFKFGLIHLMYILPQIPQECSVILQKSPTSTGYFSISTGSSVTNCRFSTESVTDNSNVSNKTVNRGGIPTHKGVPNKTPKLLGQMVQSVGYKYYQNSVAFNNFVLSLFSYYYSEWGMGNTISYLKSCCCVPRTTSIPFKGWLWCPMWAHDWPIESLHITNSCIHVWVHVAHVPWHGR